MSQTVSTVSVCLKCLEFLHYRSCIPPRLLLTLLTVSTHSNVSTVSNLSNISTVFPVLTVTNVSNILYEIHCIMLAIKTKGITDATLLSRNERIQNRHIFRHFFSASNRQSPSFIGANKKDKRVLSLHRLLKPNAVEGEQAEMKRQVQRKPFGAEMRKVRTGI